MKRRLRSCLHLMIVASTGILCAAVPFVAPNWSIVLAQNYYRKPPVPKTASQKIAEDVIREICETAQGTESALERDCDALEAARLRGDPAYLDALRQISDALRGSAPK